MSEYQNLFTTVQPTGPASAGIALPKGDSERIGTPWFWHLAGRLGKKSGQGLGLALVSALSSSSTVRYSTVRSV